MSETKAASQEAESSLNNEMASRREKLEKLRAETRVAYPNDFRRDATAGDLHAKYDALSEEELEKSPVTVRIAGRMMTRRIMGKASFATLQDMGGRIQIYVTRDDLPEGFYNDCFKKFDLGDILGIEGFVFKTKTGELSVHVKSMRLLVKSLRPLPEKFKGLTDPEARCRQRYVDLIANESSRRTFMIRSKLTSEIRRYMESQGFMEVETPMMHTIPGGANARPFITHHNALDIDMYMRIAPELYLKRLVVGGFERVFELNRNFRNEGIDVRHNPEFTMMEFYMAYADYHDLIDFTENMLRHLATAVLGDPVIRYGKEGEEPLIIDAKKIGIEIMKGWKLGHVFAAIFEETCEANLIQPTFITEYPAEVSPLARRNDENPAFCDRFEFYIAGRELGNAFSELNDADDQASRFQAQVDQKKAGDEEAMYFDHDYITALEYGLPPTAGEGIGIDRLAMLFTNSQTIRDVILFPTLRPQAKN